ncbi:RES domain-containing protein [Pseudarthrobacter psychrotolerans]|uniref:RES domain-containing protein n=1 Tax=Pseudarthrobacter psychrotolerans TaxID=2697569 RepID=A0A6P1NLV8_9MICC|nr:RES domain-containing protein [Pseudarthrobacter psychrotolerans]QHK18532.1 RES domain-containing protein [Pseudarthrobacter psychrotolerans]
MIPRICGTTGLALVPGPVSGHRIATVTYGALNPEKRQDGEPRDDWSRWDTPGRTIYIADTLETAFRECLAWARMKPSHKKKLGKLAALWGITPEEVMKEIQADFDRLGHMQPGHLPFSWRDERLKHVIDVPENAGMWVDMEDQATLDALSLGPAADIKPFTGLEAVDRAAAFSNDRNVTTRIAEWLRGVTLDDGSELAGVRFKSRVGNGICWAYWMRRTDLGLTEVAEAASGEEISPRESALATVTEAWEIRVW